MPADVHERRIRRHVAFEPPRAHELRQQKHIRERHRAAEAVQAIAAMAFDQLLERTKAF